MCKQKNMKSILTLLLVVFVLIGCGGSRTINGVQNSEELKYSKGGIEVFYPGRIEPNFNVLNNDRSLAYITYENDVIFVDQTIVEGIKILSYEWDFGDGEKEIGSDVTTALHKYSEPGIYNVKLTVKPFQGPERVVEKSLKVFSNSGVNSTLPNSEKELIYTYDLETSFIGNMTEFSILSDVPGPYTWVFGDGSSSTSTGKVIKHKYDSIGIYKTSVVSYDDETFQIYISELDVPITTLSDDIMVDFIIENAYPETAEGYIQVLPGVEMIFSDLSFPAGDAYWQFGDGETAQNKSSGIKKDFHTYELKDNIQNPLEVSLKEINPVTLESGFKKKKIFLIEGVVNADFEIQKESSDNRPLDIVPTNSNIKFVNTSEILGKVGDLEYRWKSSDPTSSIQKTEDATYIFSSGGDYNIEYSITQKSSGIVTTKSRNVYVRESQSNGFDNDGRFDIYFSPVFANIDEPTALSPVVRINPDFPETDYPNLFHWIIRDQKTGTIVYNSGAIRSSVVSYTFLEAGVYEATLSVANDEFTAHKTQEIYIVSEGVSDINVDFKPGYYPYVAMGLPSTSGGQVAFSDQSDLGVHKASKYLWTYGDGVTDVRDSNKWHRYTYKSPGFYDVQECIVTTTSLIACVTKTLEVRDISGKNYSNVLVGPSRKSERVMGLTGRFKFDINLDGGEEVRRKEFGSQHLYYNHEWDANGKELNSGKTPFKLIDNQYVADILFKQHSSIPPGKMFMKASLWLSTSEDIDARIPIDIYDKDATKYDVEIQQLNLNIPRAGEGVILESVDLKNEASAEWSWYITDEYDVETVVNTTKPQLIYNFGRAGTYTIVLEASSTEYFFATDTHELTVYDTKNSGLNLDIIVTSSIPAAKIEKTDIGYVDVSGQFSGLRGYNLEGKIDNLQGKSIKEWRWFYGDGESSISANNIPTSNRVESPHTYKQGTYTIRLQAIDSDLNIIEKEIVFGINHTALSVVTPETYLANGQQNKPAVFDHDVVKCPVYPKMLPDKLELGKGDTIIFQDVTEYSCGYSVHKRNWNRGRTGTKYSDPKGEYYTYTIEPTSGISTGLNFSVIDNAGGYYHIIYMFNLFNTHNTGIYRLDNKDKTVDVSPLGFYIPKQEVILRDAHPFITSSFIWTHGNDAYFSHQSDGAGNPVNPVRTAFNHSGTFWAHAANNPLGDLGDAHEIGGVSFTIPSALMYCSIGSQSMRQDIGIKNALGEYIRLPFGAAFSSQDCSPSNNREYLIYDSDSQSKKMEYDGSSTQNINTDLDTTVRMDDSEYTLVTLLDGNVNGHLNDLDVISIVYHKRLQIYIIEVYDSANNQIDFYYANSWDSITQDDVIKLPYSISDVPSLHTGTNVQYKGKNMLVLDSGKVLVGLPGGTYAFDIERGLPPTIFEDLLLVEVIKAEDKHYILNRASSDHTFPTEILVNLKGESFALFLKEYDGFVKGFGGLHYLR